VAFCPGADVTAQVHVCKVVSNVGGMCLDDYSVWCRSVAGILETSLGPCMETHRLSVCIEARQDLCLVTRVISEQHSVIGVILVSECRLADSYAHCPCTS